MKTLSAVLLVVLVSLSASLRGAERGMGESGAQARMRVLDELKGFGRGHYLFGQMATWVHNENPDMDHPSNWVRKLRDHSGRLPRYACITYDFSDDPFTDEEWNAAVNKLWDRGLLVGVFSFFANPSGGRWNDPCDIPQIWAEGENPVKSGFYRQLDRMAANFKWLSDRGIPVVYTPFVESDDRNKWHAKGGPEAVIPLYRLVHDYLQNTKGLRNIIWAYHTTQNHGALEANYPGDGYVDVIGKSAYGSGLVFSEYEWAVGKKRLGKVIWWAELGVRGKNEPPRDCRDVFSKLEKAFPELAGFVFWSDEPFYNAIGNLHAREFMAEPGIVVLE